MAILASSSKNIWQYILTRSAHTSAFYQCKSRALSYRDFVGGIHRGPSAKSSENARIEWSNRKPVENWLGSSPRVRLQFSARQYAPDVRELLRGLWSQGKDPIWLLVDQLVTTRKPHNTEETCPDFPKWKHVVDAPNFFAALQALVAQGSMPELRLDVEETAEGVQKDEVGSGDTQTSSVPTWLAMYLISAKVDNYAGAHASATFAISQLEITPKFLRAPLLLLVMCAVSGYRLQSLVPTIIQAFQDLFAHERPESDTTLAARSSIIYQYNVFLTLLSRFPLVPSLAAHVDRLLRHMHALSVPIETTTATHLMTPRQTATFLVKTVQGILESQQVLPSVEQSVSLTRYFSKRRNQREAAKHIDMARNVDPLAHAQTYLMSFREASDSLAFLRTFRAQHPHLFEGRDAPGSDSVKMGQNPSLTSRLMSRSKRHVEASQISSAAPPIIRYIYTSMLFTAALSKSISPNTFSMMADSVRAAHGTDKVLETVVLVGLLRRHAWDKARDLWSTWEKNSAELRHAAEETDAFFKRREETFGEATAVRKTLNMTEFQSFLLRRKAYSMQVDNTALAAIVRAVAGKDIAGLLDAFELMDGFAMKITHSPSAKQVASSDNSQGTRFSPHDVRLTARVINCFLWRAYSRQRPDIVFRFWDSATQYYGVELSVPTLELILRSARIAASMEQSVVSVIPRWLLRGTLRDALPADAFLDFGDEIRWMLSPKCRPGMRWNGMPAWRVARRLFREDILFANWPWLRDITVPAQPVTGDAATSHLDALQELAMGTPQVREVGEYPHLVPRARTFREYVLLLSRVQRSTEIPQVLAWMRALEVRPSRHLVSFFLGLWAEVSMGPPIDDIWVEGEHNVGGELRHGGEYGKLVAWLTEWLGEDEIPNDGEAAASLKYIRELEQNERIRY